MGRPLDCVFWAGCATPDAGWPFAQADDIFRRELASELDAIEASAERHGVTAGYSMELVSEVIGHTRADLDAF